MGVKVVLTNKSQQTGASGNKSTSDLNIRFNRLIYQRLGSLTQNKTILADYNAGKLPQEFADLLTELNKIHYNINCGQEYTECQRAYTINEYLGSLGVTETYKYKKDYVVIPPWIDWSAQEATRNIVTEINDIIYNVVTLTDNVVHNTLR